MNAALLSIVISATMAAAPATGVPAKAMPLVPPEKWVVLQHLPVGVDPPRAVTFELTIDVEGHPADCAIVISSRAQAVDRAVCRAAMRRARFQPARDAAGQPIVSVWRDRLVWVDPGVQTDSALSGADFVVSTSRVTQAPKLVGTHVLIGADGTPGQCFIESGSGVPALDAAACALVRRADIARPVPGTQSGLRSYIVAFVAGQDGILVER